MGVTEVEEALAWANDSRWRVDSTRTALPCRNQAACELSGEFLSRASNTFVLTSVHPPWYSCAKILTDMQ
jgi:hypothetical protein